jgi:hypothetical protein
MIRSFSLVLSFLFLGAASVHAQFIRNIIPSSDTAVTLDSSNLPIVGIYTYLTAIPDEPKIKAFMGIVDNGYNAINHFTDTNYAYYNYIGIEKRGSISQTWLWPQKSYNIETRDSLGNDNNVVMMGMPKESDWVLYGPYDDHTLMRNVLTYQLARQMGYWAPRTKYCELALMDFLSWNYKGVYVMMEKIKRDNNRVNISKLDSNDLAGDSLTGGYIIAVDKNINKPDSGWFSSHPLDTNVFFTYKYPSGTDIKPQQRDYIQAYVDSFENATSGPNFADPVTGFRKYIEPVSFMDFFFIQELSKNIDAYKRSAWMYKDKKSKGGKLIAGPHWDYNSAYGAALCGFDVDTGWTYPMTCWVNASFPVPFWWKRFLQDSIYTRDMKCRWIQLRSTVLDTTNIFHAMDSIAQYVAPASVRQFTQNNISDNIYSATDTLKQWFRKRLTWLDAHMPGNCWNMAVAENESLENSIGIYPNPSSNGEFMVNGLLYPAQLDVYNMVGEKIYSFSSKEVKETIRLGKIPGGIYFLKVDNGRSAVTRKLVVAGF